MSSQKKLIKISHVSLIVMACNSNVSQQSRNTEMFFQNIKMAAAKYRVRVCFSHKKSCLLIDVSCSWRS